VILSPSSRICSFSVCLFVIYVLAAYLKRACSHNESSTDTVISQTHTNISFIQDKAITKEDEEGVDAREILIESYQISRWVEDCE
jgi:hypothetical protein